MPTEDSRHSGDKASIRALLRSRLRGLTPEEREAASAELRRRIQGLPEWPSARRVAFFHPRHDEPDLLPLLEECWRLGKETALPGWDPVSEDYVFRRISHWGELRTGPFGIREPSSVCRVVALESLDLVFVPGIGFTADGRRLGRGRGFYDRLLLAFHGFSCGVCFDGQLVEWIPVEAHDVPMQRVLAPNLPERGQGKGGVD